jgi:hypothetical protein
MNKTVIIYFAIEVVITPASGARKKEKKRKLLVAFL